MKKLSTSLATLALLTSCAFFVTPANAAGQGEDHHAEQIVFSGQGTGTFNGDEMSFGFWIWCEDDDAANPYHGNCNGALYFYGLGITVHVSGEVDEPLEGIYVMDVESTRANGPRVSCNLTNLNEAVRGPNNDVIIECPSEDFPDSLDVTGSGESTDAIINVTGP